MFKKPSGAEFKKRAKEKDEKEEKVLAKVPKISNFFQPSTSGIKGNVSEVKSVDQCVNKDHDRPTDTSDVSVHVENEPSATSELENSPRKEDQQSVSNDPAFWRKDEFTREYIAQNGFKQNTESGFSGSERDYGYGGVKRYCNEGFFKKLLQNGELRNREYLVYSPSKGFVICAYCKLYSNTSSNFTEGFNDWKNASSLLQSHENSAIHRKAILAYISRTNSETRIDNKVIEARQTEDQYWKEVFKRVIATVKYLSTRGYPFRGTDHLFGSSRNGAYLGALELIAQFDPFFSQHIARFGNKGQGSTSYLSHFTCDEFIVIMGDTVLQKVIEETKESKYYSLVIDSTPDIAHVDQLTLIVRYVKKDGEPVERFLKFLPNTGHKSEELTTAVLKTLETFGLDIKDCRGQSYDNAANMSGVYSGLQARIKEHNELAEYIPCSAHSLNLVGVTAAEACDNALAFFDLVQAVYNFFSASTHRWAVLKEILKDGCPVVKSLSVTRWSARADALKALLKSLPEITESLKKISEDVDEKPACRQESKGLARKLQKPENVFLLVFWEEAMNKFHKVSKALQNENVDIGNVVALFTSLENYMVLCRDKFSLYLQKTDIITKSSEWSCEARKRKPKLFFDEKQESSDSDSNLDAKEYFRTGTYLVIIDRLIAELQRRAVAYEMIFKRFGFILNLLTLDDKNILSCCRELVKIYSKDLQDTFPDECVQFKYFLKNTPHATFFEPSSGTDDKEEKEKKKRSFSYLLRTVREGNLQNFFPNVEIILRIILSMAVTNCAGERSFSTMKRVKNYLRNSMGEIKLNALAVMAIESDMTEALDFQEVIEKFVKIKQRRKVITV